MPPPYFSDEEKSASLPKAFYYVIIVGYMCVAFGFLYHINMQV